jgi:RNA polymerase sigma-70 factor (ECF subfamily)
MSEVMGHEGGPKRSQPQPEGRRRTALFLRVRDGQSALAAVLFEELGGLLRRRLLGDTRTRALGDNPADVEDVLQTTFLRLWEKRDLFEETRGAIDAWAWVVARNAAVDVLRRRSRARTVTLLLECTEDRRAADPGSDLAAAERRQVLEEALGRETDPKVRRVLELRLVAGLTYAAVSKATGVPMGTVANWVHRLRRHLRAA